MLSTVHRAHAMLLLFGLCVSCGLSRPWGHGYPGNGWSWPKHRHTDKEREGEKNWEKILDMNHPLGTFAPSQKQDTRLLTFSSKNPHFVFESRNTSPMFKLSEDYELNMELLDLLDTWVENLMRITFFKYHSCHQMNSSQHTEHPVSSWMQVHNSPL